MEQYSSSHLQSNMSTYFCPTNNSNYLINANNNIQKQTNNSQTCLTLLRNNNNANNVVGLSSIEHESFKLIEKVQAKKSRTKYTKEQVDLNLVYLLILDF